MALGTLPIFGAHRVPLRGHCNLTESLQKLIQQIVKQVFQAVSNFPLKFYQFYSNFICVWNTLLLFLTSLERITLHVC